MDKHKTQLIVNDVHGFWKDYAEAFAHPLKSNGILSRFVQNPNITGAYAETWVRFLVKTMLPRFRLSTGTIIRPSDRVHKGKQNPQCDLIVWDPTQLPALFEQGDFALVPTMSALAIIEVKRTCSNVEEFEKQLKERRDCLLDWRQQNVLGIVVNHKDALFGAEATPDWIKVRGKTKPPAITRLLDEGNDADANGVFAFIYFLGQLKGDRWLYDYQLPE